jgi:DNA-binding transcriptional LysR family regulator
VAREPFRITVAPGVIPTRWVRTWERRRSDRRLEVTPVEEAEQLGPVRSGSAEMGFVRLPVDRTGLHLIPLWHERPVVVVPRDHVVSVFEHVASADLQDEYLWGLAEVTARQAVEAVAAGTGVVVLPAAVARALHRKDVVAVPVTEVPQTQIGLAWREDAEDPDIETFIGIVRGRTERSSRGG